MTPAFCCAQKREIGFKGCLLCKTVKAHFLITSGKNGMLLLIYNVVNNTGIVQVYIIMVKWLEYFLIVKKKPCLSGWLLNFAVSLFLFHNYQLF